MKKLTKNMALFVIGLLLAALPAAAGLWNDDLSVGGSTNYGWGGGGVDVPSNATVNWYGYAYGGQSPNAFARVMAYMAPYGMFMDEYVSANGSDSGSQGVPAAGSLSIYLEAGAWEGEAAGCGVTVAW